MDTAIQILHNSINRYNEQIESDRAEALRCQERADEFFSRALVGEERCRECAAALARLYPESYYQVELPGGVLVRSVA